MKKNELHLANLMQSNQKKTSHPPAKKNLTQQQGNELERCN
jgi:hypothetical protein